MADKYSEVELSDTKGPTRTEELEKEILGQQNLPLCKWTRSQIFTVVGIAIALFELVVACLYNWHIFGSIVGICLAVASCVKLYMAIKDYDQERTKKLSLANALVQSSKPKQQVLAEYEKLQSTGLEKPTWVKVLNNCYIVCVVIVFLLAIIRTYTLVAQSSWIVDLDGRFPEACGSWSEQAGCTRVTLNSSDCTRPVDIPEENSLYFENGRISLSRDIESCIGDISGAKIKNKAQVIEADQVVGEVLHVSVGSKIWGFLDDLFVTSEPYGEDAEARQVKIQSQLRIGKGDINANYLHIKTVLDCLNSKYDNADTSPRPCSL